MPECVRTAGKMHALPGLRNNPSLFHFASFPYNHCFDNQRVFDVQQAGSLLTPEIMKT
jgi:hypothetical protein